MTPVEELEAAFEETTTGIKHLEMVLAKFERRARHLFTKPVKEMGASEKLKLSKSIIELFKFEDEELEKHNGG